MSCSPGGRLNYFFIRALETCQTLGIQLHIKPEYEHRLRRQVGAPFWFTQTLPLNILIYANPILALKLKHELVFSHQYTLTSLVISVRSAYSWCPPAKVSISFLNHLMKDIKKGSLDFHQ